MGTYITDPPGTVKQFAGSIAPAGWLVCDGSLVSRTTYSDLFSAIGTQYGAGDGSTTFALPDGQGRMLVGLGGHADVGTLGNNEGAALAARRPRHKHSITDAGHSHTVTIRNNDPAGVNPVTWGLELEHAAAGSNPPNSNIPDTNSSTGITVGPQTGNEPTDGGAYLVIRHIIKY